MALFDARSFIDRCISHIAAMPRPSGRPPVGPAIERAWAKPGIRFNAAGKSGTKGRPRAPDTGGVTFHFSHTSISKSSTLQRRLRASRSGRGLPRTQASAHVRYIERAGAAEVLKTKALSAPAALQAYIERAPPPGIEPAAEAFPAETEVAASFGTTGRTRAERERFWTLVEEAERSPRGDTLTFDPSADPNWWHAAVSGRSEAPKELQPYLTPNAGAPFSVKLTTERAFAICTWADGIGRPAPLTISPGRGGRVQTRIIAELPHELSPEQRLAILRRFTAVLEERSFPYWAVIHAPGQKNDARNYHVHIAYYDRPCRRIRHPKTGREVWDFEITQVNVTKDRHRHLIRPYQQSRDRETSRPGWIHGLRARWSKICNDVLATAGAGKRYDPRSYADMGLDIDPMRHIPSRAYNKERKGEETTEGIHLAVRQWNDVRNRTLSRHHQDLEDTKRRIRAEAKTVKTAARAQINNPRYQATIAGIENTLVEAADSIAELKLERSLIEYVTDRLASRDRLKRDHSASKKKTPRAASTKPSGALRESLDFLEHVLSWGSAAHRRKDREIAAASYRPNRLRSVLQELAKNPPRTNAEAGQVLDALLFRPTRTPYTPGQSVAPGQLRISSFKRSVLRAFDTAISSTLAATGGDASRRRTPTDAGDRQPGPPPSSSMATERAIRPATTPDFGPAPRRPTPEPAVRPTTSTIDRRPSPPTPGRKREQDAPEPRQLSLPAFSEISPTTNAADGRDGRPSPTSADATSIRKAERALARSRAPREPTLLRAAKRLRDEAQDSPSLFPDVPASRDPRPETAAPARRPRKGRRPRPSDQARE